MHPKEVRGRAALATPTRLRQRPWGAMPFVGLLTRGAAAAFLGALWLLLVPAEAQLTDLTQTPNTENAGIQKSLEEQIGAGRGDVITSDSSLFIIGRDPFRAIRRGRQVFQRKFTVAQGVGPRINDGIGDIETNTAIGNGLMDSCAGCHANPRGAAGSGGAMLFVRPDHRDAPHLFGVGLKEMLADEITADLRSIREEAIVQARAQGRTVTRELRSKGIDYGRLTAFSEGTVDTSQIQGVNPDLRVRPLFAEGRDFSMRVLAVNAWRNAMGLIAEDPDFAAAAARENPGRVVTPTGFVLDGTLDTFPTPPAPRPEFGEAGFEIPVSLVDFMEFYLLHYFTPGTYQQTRATALGRKVMEAIGCTRCHIPHLPLERDRRVADIQTVHDQERGVFNNLFATAHPLFRTVDDGTGFPPLKRPAGGSFLVENIFTDFKRHDLGPHFHERNFNGTMTTQFMTLPLWGVGNTPPYGHDGRSINLREVILRHGGEAQTQRDAFAALPDWGQDSVIRFLESLVIFPPDDTASTLDPGDPQAPGFPQRGHGSIRLSELFNDPSDLE
jgi:Di-haem oxidoreductase, putative peroxidase